MSRTRCTRSRFPGYIRDDCLYESLWTRAETRDMLDMLKKSKSYTLMLLKG